MSTSLSIVARVSDLPDRGLLAVQGPDGERVCLIRVGTAVTAARDECPHAAFPLSAGEILADGTLQCGWHGARFDCATGAVRQGPATNPLVLYDVAIDGDSIRLGGLR